MSNAEASGERSIAIGRDAIHSIFATGDHTQFFFGDYQRLADAYLHPWPVFERVQLDRFTGRGWLTSRVDDFLTCHDRGVFVLEAEAGLGKTAFLAHLARQRDYIHHFVELARGPDGVAPGLESLAAQLVRAWGLNPYTADAVLPSSAARPEFLQNLLNEAADRRDRTRPGEKIVLVVDALDEAGTPSGQNVLGLPRILPRGVYLVVSHRPVDVTLFVEGPRHVEPLKAEDQKNLADMRAFLGKALTWPGIQKALGEGRISESQFVETLLEKSRGVWIYLHYVVAEIEAGRRSPLKLEELPRDLWQYYADYWKRWREAHSQTWDSVDLPLLTTLAAAQDSLTLGALLALSEIDRKPDVSGRIRDVLDFEWIPYLAISTAGPHLPCSYRFYHASLRDFFSGAIDRSNLTDAEWKRVQRFAEATKQAHARIAEYLINRWGGWDANLPALRAIDPTRLDSMDRYGLRHLAAHLEAAGREADLHRLMRLEWSDGQGEQTRTRFENTWHTVHERVGDTSGYLSDVDRAWQLAERAYAGRQSSSAIGLQCRYALIVSSLSSLAGNIPPALLAALVEKGIWPGPQGLAYARQMQGPELRTRALAALAPYLNPAERDRALRETLEAARAIGDEWPRSQALAALAPRLAELGHTAEALEAARAIGSKGYPSLSQSQALAALAPHLTAPLLREALEAVRAIKSEGYRSQYQSQALAALAPRLAELGHPAEALEVARAIGYERDRSQALAALAPHLGPTERDQAVREALEAARAIRANQPSGTAQLEAARDRSEALAALAPRLAELGHPAEALAVARASGGYQSQALAALAPRLTAPWLGEALEAAWANKFDESRALAALALRLAELPPATLYPHWSKKIRLSATRTRDGLLGDLCALVPVLAALGGTEEVVETFRAIQDVGRWWP